MAVEHKGEPLPRAPLFRGGFTRRMARFAFPEWMRAEGPKTQVQNRQRGSRQRARAVTPAPLKLRQKTFWHDMLAADLRATVGFEGVVGGALAFPFARQRKLECFLTSPVTRVIRTLRAPKDSGRRCGPGDRSRAFHV